MILHGSCRVNGVTGQLADEFACGAKDAGHHVTKVELREKTIKDCAGCGACQINGGNCVQKDDMATNYQEILEADVIVLASPVYYYTWISLMKRTLDRTFALQSLLHNKKFSFFTQELHRRNNICRSCSILIVNIFSALKETKVSGK